MHLLIIILTAISILIQPCNLEGAISQENDLRYMIQEFENAQRELILAELYPTVNMHKSHLRALIDLCYQYEIDPDFALAIIYVESKYDPMAKNKRSSATGYGQLIQSTATAIANMIPEIKSYNHSKDAYDPYINLHITVFYINRCIHASGGNLLNALKQYRGVNDQPYFKKVFAIRNELKDIKGRIQKGKK